MRDLSRRTALGSLGLAILSLSACAGPFSTLDPAGPAAASIAEIWYVMLIGGTVLFLMVMVLFALAFLKPNWRWSEKSNRGWLLYGGFVMPVIVLSALLVFALTRGEGLLAHPSSDGRVVVEARGERWQWVFSYPDAPQIGETIDVLHIPAGRPVDVAITTQDVIHSFWVPRLGGKMDALPGHVNTMRIEADTAGVYRGLCSEYCGFGHSGMMFDVVAHEPGAYEAARDAGFPSTGEAMR